MAGRVVFFVVSLFFAAALFFLSVFVEARAESSPAAVDGSQVGGNPRFFFLPPPVPEPEALGGFDANAAPIVEVCLLADGECAGEPAESFAVGDGLRASERHGHYLGLWRRGEEFSGREVLWRSDALDVAGVDENGIVTGISEGAGGLPFRRSTFARLRRRPRLVLRSRAGSGSRRYFPE